MIFGKIVGRVMHGFKVVGHVAGKRRAIGLFPGDIKDARVGGCSTKILCHAKVHDRGCLHLCSKVFAQLFTICRSHPFVGCDVAEMPALLEQAHAALIKKAINIAAGGVGCVILGLPDFFVRSAKLLNLLDSTAKCNTTDWLEVRCVSIGTLTTTSELHDELYAPHQRGTLPDLGHVAY